MKVKKGDLLDCFDDGIEAFGHGCNCLKSFGKGIARSIKERYPAAYQADLNFPLNSKERLGGFSIAEMEKGIIFNIYSQYSFQGAARNLNYEAIYTGLCLVRHEMEGRNLTKIALPYLIGCGLAKGDWRIVEKMIECAFQDSGIEVTLYKLD